VRLVVLEPQPKHEFESGLAIGVPRGEPKILGLT
jgi:hypothetical protein